MALLQMRTCNLLSVADSTQDIDGGIPSSWATTGLGTTLIAALLRASAPALSSLMTSFRTILAPGSIWQAAAHVGPSVLPEDTDFPKDNDDADERGTMATPALDPPSDPLSCPCRSPLASTTSARSRPLPDGGFAKGYGPPETCNGISWDSLKRAMLERSKAEIIIAQETKILPDATISTAQRQARRLRWNPVLSRAHQIAMHHGSGGCATMARMGFGIVPVAQTCLHEDLGHRL